MGIRAAFIVIALAACKEERPPAAPPPSRLFCNGGDGINVSSRYDLHFGQVWSAYRGVAGHELMGELVVELDVTPSTTPAGAAGEALAPGTCAYAARIMSATEPHRLRWEGPLQPGVTLAWRSERGSTTPPIVSSPFDGLAGPSRVRFWGDVSVDAQVLRIGNFAIEPR
ncbi:MAG: hypothetical protein JNJ54_28125 [Myxococcaceae bacterium]|nr:hypothetical protein [Myxococcaceae bacterium]